MPRLVKPKVYIAGPISIGDQLANINKGMQVWSKLHAAGFTPFCPHWSALQHLHNPELEHKDWLEFDFAWLECCDALLRMPGESKGADMETDHAEMFSIPIYFYGVERSLDEMILKMKERLLR